MKFKNPSVNSQPKLLKYAKYHIYHRIPADTFTFYFYDCLILLHFYGSKSATHLTVKKYTNFQDSYLFLSLIRTVWPFFLFYSPKKGRWRHTGDANLKIFKNIDQSRIPHLTVNKYTNFQDSYLFLSLDRAVWSFCPFLLVPGVINDVIQGEKMKVIAN